MTNEKWVSLLGLANRARKVISGEELVIKEVRNGRAKLVILAKDASKNTSKKVLDKCKYYRVPVVYSETREQLGRAIGKESRVAAAVIDSGFAKKLATMFYD
ncbi:YlxQ family RNA-binding protein [Siminovitchia sediminis]|uniref:YlxQ family RNA-binding protein n=1 Tax=Siminovitchia sediminis TaxID=1274353 RepID=A0ABW4KEF1_9BACI